MAGDGREIEFDTFDLPGRQLRPGQELFYGIDRLTLRCLGDGRWTIRTPDGLVREFEVLRGPSQVARLTKIRNRLGQSRYDMNIANAVVAITDPHAATTTFEYDEHLWKTSETDALGGVTRFEYDARGNETKRILANGATFTMAYNADGQLEQLRDPFGVSWGWRYDRSGRLVASFNTSGETLAIEYDALYPRRMTRSDGRDIHLEHDGFGQLTKLWMADGALEERWYDRVGQLVKVRDGTGRATRMVYDLEGRVVEWLLPDGSCRRFAYTPEGDRTVDADPLRYRSCGYSGFHQLAWIEEAGARIELSYDSESELVGVVNEDGDTYTYKRDACGRIGEERTFEGRLRTYARDALGNVTTEFLPNKKTRTFAYDVLGNVTTVRHGDDEEAYTYDVVGNPMSATNGAGTVTFERDARRRLVGERFGDDWVASTLDVLGRRVEVKTSKGFAQRIARTAMGDVQAVGLWEPDGNGKLRPAWFAGFERDAAGAERARRMPGGIETRWSRDAVGRPSSFAVTRGQDLLDRTDYHWASIDRLEARTDARRGKTEYLHDRRGRLAGARGADGTTTWRAPNRVGNLFKTEERMDRRYGKGGVLLEDAGTAYEYDAVGNVVEKRTLDGRTWKYAWNGAGMLTRVELPDGEAVTFAYDALGRRVSKTSSRKTTRWLWDGNVPIHEWTRDDAAAAPPEEEVTTWLFEPESFAPLAKRTPDGKRFSIVTDYLGTPREMFDEAGKLAWKAQLDVYGVVQVDEGAASDCPWRSAGQYADDETGLYYNRFRYYDPARGTYISQDPIRLHGGAELYGFVRDPLTWVDPLGLTGCGNPNDNAAEGIGAGGGGGATRLFRAVSPAELGDIKATGAFRPSPTGLEGKYFSTTAEGASQYGRMAVRGFGDAPYTIVETTMPNGTAPLAPFVDRGIPTVVVPNTALPTLGQPVIWPFMPIP